MEIPPGDYADALRAVGLFIAQARTQWTEVSGTGDHWAIRWEQAPETWLGRSELDALRLVARLHRGAGFEQPPFPLGQQLRAGGWLFDETRASSFTVAAAPDGLRLSATVADKSGSRTSGFAQIQQLAFERQQARFG